MVDLPTPAGSGLYRNAEGGSREWFRVMISAAFWSARRYAPKLHRLVLAAAMAMTVFAAATPGVLAQGRTLSSSSYVTPFPEQNRYRLYVFGDSLGDGMWAGLYRAFKPDGNVDIVKKSRVSTGFVRTDYFDWPKAYLPLARSQRFELQKLLTTRGFLRGKIDGILGSGTRAAIRAYQNASGMTVDGYPSVVVLKHLQRNS